MFSTAMFLRTWKAPEAKFGTNCALKPLMSKHWNTPQNISSRAQSRVPNTSEGINLHPTQSKILLNFKIPILSSVHTIFLKGFCQYLIEKNLINYLSIYRFRGVGWNFVLFVRMAHKRTKLICSRDLASLGEQTGSAASFKSCRAATRYALPRWWEHALFFVSPPPNNLINLYLKIPHNLNLFNHVAFSFPHNCTN